jgi:hypothetical protein
MTIILTIDRELLSGFMCFRANFDIIFHVFELIQTKIDSLLFPNQL